MNKKYHSTIPATGMNVPPCIGNISWGLQTPHFNYITVATHQVIQDTHTAPQTAAQYDSYKMRLICVSKPHTPNRIAIPAFRVFHQIRELETRHICSAPDRQRGLPSTCRLGYRRVLKNLQGLTIFCQGISGNIYTKPFTVHPTADQGRNSRANKRTRPLAGHQRDYGLIPVGTNNVVYASFRPVRRRALVIGILYRYLQEELE